ncbi:response regulator transcription factor [Tenacibaculum agarivorans]|uniref:response regulator transcription factor n=1 Tax=Tenacibaculum agarivorans TaxID=1908389 RepID=UPI00094BB6D1|nr:response regulator transcription factor [Tenacibaculum agarivorans]
MKAKTPIHIIIADDHTLFIHGLRSLLDGHSHIKIIGEANNGLEVLQLLQSTEDRVDIIVLDIDMPKMNGIATLKAMKDLGLPIKTLMLTMHDEGSFIKQLIRAGANGYMLKDQSAEEFVNALETVMHEGKYLKGEVLDKYIKANETPEPEPLHLTKREVEVLQLIANDHTSGEIALQLNIEVSTVQTYRRNLIEKIGVKSSHGLVKFAVEKKYV